VHRSPSCALGLARGVAAFVLLLAAAGDPARADDAYEPAAPPAARPTYRTLRFEEDWSGLRDPSALPARDLFDPVKFLALDRDGTIWLSLGGQARARLEGWSNYEFGADPGDDTDDVYFQTRLRAHADLHLGETFRVFAEAKSALVTDVSLPGGDGPTRRDVLALQNGFLEIAPPIAGRRPLVLRGGRQELLFGAQRLVSPSDWTNARRTFDGASAELSVGEAKATAFWLYPVQVRERKTNDHRDDDRFYGVYATSRLPLDANLDLYWLGRQRDHATVNGTSGRENRQTFGARGFGPLGDTGLDLEIESAVQTGRVGDGSVLAGMATAELGWWLVDAPFSPRIHGAFDYASGDPEPGGDAGTFDPLFPYGHRWLGQLDLVGRRNIAAASGGVSLRPYTATTATLAFHQFWRASTRDALYDATGAVVRSADGGSRRVGCELDLVLGYRLDPHTLIDAGYGHFFTGDFIRETGRSRDADFAYLSIQYTM
jgi:hypothetical protein